MHCKIKRTNEATGKARQGHTHTHTRTHSHTLSHRQTINETMRAARGADESSERRQRQWKQHRSEALCALFWRTALAITADSNCLVDTYLPHLRPPYTLPPPVLPPFNPAGRHLASLILHRQTDIAYTQ